MNTLIPSANEFLREKQPYAYWLGNIPGIGNKTLHSLLDDMKYPDHIYHASDSELLAHMTKAQLQNLRKSQSQFQIWEEYRALCDKRISFLPCYHPAFPDKLRTIPDAPYALYFYGKLPPKSMPLIAIIGARNCSAYGKKIAIEFASTLAASGVGIVSGLARGIDCYAEQAAVDVGGKTYAILGSGVDICYPKENLSLYRSIPANGALISEFPPQTQPKANHFPLRNRIISGLADAVIVVEAREKSGTLITVDMALEQGREVYAIPGRIDDALSFGCNKLLKQGANIATTPADVISNLCVETLHCFEPSNTRKNTALLNEKEQCILHLLNYEPIPLDKIFSQAAALPLCHNLSIPELMHIMTSLKMKGIVSSIGNSYCISLS